MNVVLVSDMLLYVKPPRPPGRGFATRAYAPGKEVCNFEIAPLDPVLPHGACGEQAGQEFSKDGSVADLEILGAVIDLEAGMTLLLDIFHMTKTRLLW